MASRESLDSIAEMLVSLSDEAVESLLVTFDALLDASDLELRPVAVDLLRSRAAGCPNPTRSERLLRAANDIAADQACARTAQGLTAKQAVEALAGMDAAEWQPPAEPGWPQAAAPEPSADGEEADKAEAESGQEAPPPPSRQRKVRMTTAEIRTRNTRKTSLLQVGGFRPTLDPAACNFGKSPLGLRTEEWPTWESKPLMFVCQMNLTTAPAVPPLLADIQMITFFVSPELGDLHRENGANWRLRAYPSLEGLAPLLAPPGAPQVKKGFECRWEEGEDHPNYDDREMVTSAGSRPPRTNFENLARTKIGGYASSIQSEPWWGHTAHPSNPKYCLQINSEEKAGLFWGDGGTIYVARGTEPGSLDRWFLDWQCF